jgi:hypothetical protein
MVRNILYKRHHIQPQNNIIITATVVHRAAIENLLDSF